MPGLRPVSVKGIQAALRARSDPPLTEPPLSPRGKGADETHPSFPMRVVSLLNVCERGKGSFAPVLLYGGRAPKAATRVLRGPQDVNKARSRQPLLPGLMQFVLQPHP